MLMPPRTEWGAGVQEYRVGLAGVAMGCRWSVGPEQLIS